MHRNILLKYYKLLSFFILFTLLRLYFPEAVKGAMCSETFWDCECVDVTPGKTSCDGYQCEWVTQREDCGGSGGSSPGNEIRFRVRFDANHDNVLQNFNIDDESIPGTIIPGDPAITWNRGSGPICDRYLPYVINRRDIDILKTGPNHDPFDPVDPGNLSGIRYPNDCGNNTREPLSRETFSRTRNFGFLFPDDLYIRTIRYGRFSAVPPFCRLYDSAIADETHNIVLTCNPPTVGGPGNWVTFLLSDVPPPPSVSTCSVSSSIASTAAAPYEMTIGTPLSIGTNFSSIVPAGVSATVSYSAVTSGVVNFTTATNVNVPVPPGSVGVGNYASSVTAQSSPGAVAGATTEIKADVLVGANTICTTSTYLRLINPPIPAWYQIRGGDIISVESTSNIASPVPTAQEFVASDYLGIPIFAGQLNPPSSVVNIGDPGWKVDTTFKGHLAATTGMYDYDYFRNKFGLTAPEAQITETYINDETYFATHPGLVKDGYHIYLRPSTLTFSPVGGTELDFRDGVSQKIIIFVDNAVLIHNKIRLDDGIDFFMLLSRNYIEVRPGVGDSSYVNAGNPLEVDLEGIYLTNNQFITNNGEVDETHQLYVRGSVISFFAGGPKGVDFQRDLGGENINYPAEIFEFAPDQLMLFPPFFSEKSITWKEVAP